MVTLRIFRSVLMSFSECDYRTLHERNGTEEINHAALRQAAVLLQYLYCKIQQYNAYLIEN